MSGFRGLAGMHRCLGFACCVVLAACGPAPSKLQATPAPNASPSPTNTVSATGTNLGIKSEALRGIAIEVWYPWFGVEASLFGSQVQEFNQTNPWGIKVVSTGQNNYTQLYDNVTDAFPTADRPHLVVALPEDALAWESAGYVVDLADYVSDPEYGLSDAEANDIPNIFWTQDVVGGKRLGIPAERSAQLLVYNKTWGRDLGFELAPQSATEFRAQACRSHLEMLTDADKTNDGQGGWLIDTGWMTSLSWLTAFGGGILEGSGYRFLTPKNLAALTFVKQLYDDGCSWTAQAGADPATAFAERKALFATARVEQLSDFARAMASANNADEWTVQSFPGPAQPGLVIYGSSYFVLKSTQEKQLASWLFVRWLLSAENQKKWVEATGLFPLRSSSLSLLGDYQKSHTQWSAAVTLLPVGQIQPQLASWRQVRVMLGDGFDAMYRSNTPAGRVAEILAIMDSTSSDLSR